MSSLNCHLSYQSDRTMNILSSLFLFCSLFSPSGVPLTVSGWQFDKAEFYLQSFLCSCSLTRFWLLNAESEVPLLQLEGCRPLMSHLRDVLCWTIVFIILHGSDTWRVVMSMFAVTCPTLVQAVWGLEEQLKKNLFNPKTEQSANVVLCIEECKQGWDATIMIMRLKILGWQPILTRLSIMLDSDRLFLAGHGH